MAMGWTSKGTQPTKPKQAPPPSEQAPLGAAVGNAASAAVSPDKVPAQDTNDYFTDDSGIREGLSLGGRQAYAGEQEAIARARGDQAAAAMSGVAGMAGQTGAGYAQNVSGAGVNSDALGRQALGQANEFGQWQANQANSLMGQGAAAGNRAALQGNFGAQSGALGAAQAQGANLANLEQTQGPSAAQAQLSQATNQGMNDALTLARSGRGLGGSAASSAAAGARMPMMQANAANASATLRAQEDALWRQRQAANLSSAAGVNLSAGQQFGNQSEANLNAAINGRAQNDAAQASLYGQGLNTMQSSAGNLAQGYGQALQGSAQNAAAQQAAGQTYNAGMNTQLQGMGQAYNAGAGGQTLGLQTQQAALGGQQQQIANMLQEYGIKNDLAVQNSQALNQMIGTGVGTAATVGAMMVSDERQKVKLSSPVTGNPYGRTGAPGGPADRSDLSPWGSTGRGSFDAAQRQSVDGPAAAEKESEKRLSAAIASAGDKIQGGLTARTPMRSHGAPTALQYRPVQFDAPNVVMSDERSKTKIAELESQLAQFRSDTGGPAATELAGAGKRDIDTQALDMAQRGAPDFSQSPNYQYVYKDPSMPGAAPGVQTGPMAQDLEAAGSGAVQDTEQGKMVDTGRLAMETAGAVGETQARQDDIERQFSELQAMMSAKQRPKAGRRLAQ